MKMALKKLKRFDCGYNSVDTKIVRKTFFVFEFDFHFNLDVVVQRLRYYKQSFANRSQMAI